MDGWVGGRMDMDEWMDGEMHGWMAGWQAGRLPDRQAADWLASRSGVTSREESIYENM